MTRVLESLIENAAYFSPAGASVTVAEARQMTAEDQGGVEFSVRDRGPGFPSEDLPRVFEPFYTRRAGGTGLGLAIAQRIVEEHGGSITAANASDGERGAVVKVWLPLAP